jgi:hypothetical protein
MRYATLCFFGGMFVIWLLDKLVHLILKFASQGMKALDIIRRKKKVRRLPSGCLMVHSPKQWNTCCKLQVAGQAWPAYHTLHRECCSDPLVILLLLQQERVNVGGRTATASTTADPSLPSASTLAKYDKPAAPGDSSGVVARAMDLESQATSGPGAAQATIQPHCGCHSVADVLSGGYVAQGTPQAVVLTADRLQPLPLSGGASGGDPGSDRDVPVHEGGVCDTQPDRAVEGDEVVAAALQTDNALSRMGESTEHRTARHTASWCCCCGCRRLHEPCSFNA